MKPGPGFGPDTPGEREEEEKEVEEELC